jgi:hypothetical protein
MSVSPSQIYGFTINGDALSAIGSSGYVDATPFLFSIYTNPSDGITQAAITTSFQVIWWFGDGTYSTEFSPTHTYNWPGSYEVKLGLYNSNLTLPSLSATTPPFTFSKTITASSYVQDRLEWNTSLSGYYNKSWNDILVGNLPAGACFYGYQSCKTGVASSGPIPLAFNYFTSAKSIDQVNFNFYSQNSFSQPWTETPDSQLAGLRPRWRFTTVPTLPLDEGDVISSYIPTSSTEIRILSSGALSSTGTVVGLSGTVEFYYIDDIPSTVVNNNSGVLSLSANPTTIWVTLDTSQVPNLQEYSYTSYPSFSNSSVLLSSYFYVKTLTPDHINVTVNGSVDLNPVYWPAVESRFVTTIASPHTTGTAEFLSNKNLLNQPTRILSGSNPDTVFYATLSSGYDNLNSVQPQLSAVFNLSTAPTTGNYLEYTITKSDSLGRSTGGAYIGTFTPYSSAGTAVLCVGIANGSLYATTDFIPSITTGYNPVAINAVSTGNSPVIYNITDLKGSSSSFGVFSFETTYFARKFGGGFDYGATLKSYALQPTISENTVLFDTFLSSIAGVSATYDETFGGVVYEKIANYVANISDPYTNNVDQFYDLANLLGLELDNYNYQTPPQLSRVVDMYSVQQSRVWGARSQFSRNFSLSAGSTNLGFYASAFNIQTAVVSAGQKIVFSDLFDSTKYELIEVPAILSYASASARGLGDRVSPLATYPLTAYPLSAFFGWGMQTPIESNYKVYDYYPSTDSIQKEGLINWEDPITSLSESASGHNEWVKDGGTLETIYNYYIHKGLGLIP